MKDKEYIDRIITYCEKINKYMNGITSIEIFENHELNLDAVMLNLQQIGETAKKLSINAKNGYSDIDWQKIIGLRNMISHEYEGIDITIIFDIATVHVPHLLNALNYI